MNALLKPPCDKAVGAPTQGQTNPSNRILFVEDDIAVRDAIARVLICSGYHVDVAEDGAAGWEALRATRYDLLITDNKMPKLSGVELVKKLRSAHMKLPVILASAALPPEESSQNSRLQFAATLLKPFTIDELLETVKAVLGATAMAASARNLASPDRSGRPGESLSRWRSRPPLAVAKGMKRNAGMLGQEFREPTLSRNLASMMDADGANRNGVQGKSESAGYNRLPRVFSNPTPTVHIRSQKGLVVLIGLVLFLSCLWMFNRPN